MTEQYRMGTVISDYLKKLDVHPINIAEAVSDENYRKSYQLIQENPEITKREFLERMGIKEFHSSGRRVQTQARENTTTLTATEKYLIRGLQFFPLTYQEREEIFMMVETAEEQIRLMKYMASREGASVEELKNVASQIIKMTRQKSKN